MKVKISEKLYHADYINYLQEKTIEIGRIIVFAGIPAILYFILQDIFIIKIPGLIYYRLFFLIPFIIYISAYYTLFNKHRRLIIFFHSLFLIALNISILAFIYYFSIHDSSDIGNIAGAINSYSVVLFIIFVFSGISKKYLLPIIVVPFITTLILVLIRNPNIEIGLLAHFSNPALLILVLVIYSRYSEKKDYNEFALTKVNEEQLAQINIALGENIKAEKRYKALTQTSFAGFAIFDIEGRFSEVNDAYCKISGYSREALLSMNIKDLVLDEVDKQIDEHVEKISYNGCEIIESRHRKSDGTIFHTHISIPFMPNEKLFICFLNDITDRKKTEKDLLYRAHYDYLTEIYNRRFFEEEWKRLDKEENLPISIIMGDINCLKLINDSLGHSKGDKLIIETAKILKSHCRKEDTVSRIGGDEFGILLPKTDSQSAQRICDSIYGTCKGYALDGSSIYPIISLGYATKNFETETMDNILTAAEECMSRHKLLESKSAHNSIVASIKAIMFEKSQNAEEHTGRLRQLSKSVGAAMSLTAGQLNKLELLSTLHDIGKMGISAAILSKRGKLSNEEWIEMRKHPEVGFRIAQATPEFAPIAEYILYHHERWDGKGYPLGLIGEKIPLLSRIVAIVDSFDAMTNNRTYRVTMTNEEAIEEIRRNSGTQFDPKVARVFIEKVLGQV